MIDENNIKVTNAVLGVEMVHVKKSLDRLDETVADAVKEMKEQAERTTDVEKCIIGLKIHVDENSRKTQNWDIANSALGLALAGVLAYFGLRN